MKTASEFLSLVAPAGTTQTLSFSVSGGNLSIKHSGNVILDYSGHSVAQILNYANDNRIIALQRPLRNMTDAELKKLLSNPMKMHAAACGGKIVTDAERIAALVRVGMPEPLARLAVTDPTRFETVMASAASSKS